MAQTEEKALDAILESTKTDLARITENEFKTRLLPVLTATVDDAELDIWLDIAGSWQRAIAVTDAAGRTSCSWSRPWWARLASRCCNVAITRPTSL